MEYSYKEKPNLKYRPNMEDKSKSIDVFNNNTDSGIFCIFDGQVEVKFLLFCKEI